MTTKGADFFPKKRYISSELESFAIITIDAGHDDDELDMEANAFSVMELLINLFPQMNGAKYHLWQIKEILSWVIKRISTNAFVQK